MSDLQLAGDNWMRSLANNSLIQSIHDFSPKGPFIYMVHCLILISIEPIYKPNIIISVSLSRLKPLQLKNQSD